MSKGQKYNCPICKYNGLTGSQEKGYTHYCPNCRVNLFSYEVRQNVGLIEVLR